MPTAFHATPESQPPSPFISYDSDAFYKPDPYDGYTARDDGEFEVDQPSMATFDEDSPWAKKTILSLDGGGIRGFSTLLILQSLMAVVRRIENEKDPNVTSSYHPLPPPKQQAPKYAESTSLFLPCHYFDYIAGSSTGGLIAILLGRLRANEETASKVYKELAKKVFEKPPSSLKRFLLQERRHREKILLGIIDRMPNPALPSIDENDKQFESDSFRCRTVVCALQSDKDSDSARTPYLFRSYSHPVKSAQPFERNPGDMQKFLIRDVARATSAAPSYFKSIKIDNSRFFDAGVVLNNPSWEIFKEVNQMHDKYQSHHAVDLLLSLGSGSFESDRRDAQFGGKSWKTLVSYTTMARNMKHLDDICNRLEDQLWAPFNDLNLYRFSVDLGPREANPNESRYTTFAGITETTKAYIGKNERTINECARMLVDRRRARATTMQWESFALGTRYRCTQANCPYARGGGKRPFRDQNELLDHLVIYHDIEPPNSNNYEEIQHLVDAGRTNSE